MIVPWRAPDDPQGHGLTGHQFLGDQLEGMMDETRLLELYQSPDEIGDVADIALRQQARISRLLVTIERQVEQIRTLREALAFYVGVCGNTAAMVGRLPAMEAYQKGCAALAATESKP